MGARPRELGVDVIEAGFPIASPGDFEAVQAIARQVEGPITLQAWLAVQAAGRHRPRLGRPDRCGPAAASTYSSPRVPFTANSKLKMAKDEIIRRAVEAVQRAKAVCDDVEFSPEDAARTELDFLAEVVEPRRRSRRHDC